MFGPKPKGFWSQHADTDWSSLHAGIRYVVRHEFEDFDGVVHPVGEEWLFLGASFLPYDDGLSLFVSLDGQQEWHIRLQWRPESQGQVIDEIDRFVTAAG